MGNGGDGHTARSDADRPPPRPRALVPMGGGRGAWQSNGSALHVLGMCRGNVPNPRPFPRAARSVGVPLSRLSPCTIAVRELDSRSDLSFWGVSPMQLQGLEPPRLLIGCCL